MNDLHWAFNSIGRDYAVFFRAGDIRGRAMVTMGMRVDTR